MEKLKKILFIFISLFMCGKITTVNAEKNNGKLYEIYWQKAGVNVFAKDMLYGVMDYNGWMIVSSTDDKVYYCIEPEAEMYNESNAIESSHTIYRGEQIVSNTRLTNEMAKRVQLLAYYGYKYKNHTDKKWYGITQVMIWNTVIKNAYGNYKNTTWAFKESRYGNVNTNLYKKEMQELEDLVASHGKTPSFNNSTIKVGLGKEVEITDKNLSLNNFIIGKSSIANIRVNGNTLIIKGEKIGKETISLTNDVGLRDNYLAYVGEKQDLISRGEVDYIKASFNIEVEAGTLVLTKKDKETNSTTPQGDASLLNSVYEIFDENDNLIKEITIDKEKFTLDLPYGTYKIKEKIPPKGYKLNEDIITVTLSEDNKKQEIDLFDLVIKGTHIINKSKGGAGEKFTEEQDAIFQVTNAQGKIVGIIKTFKRGVGTIVLPYGKYKITQIKGTNNYSFIAPYEIVITKDNEEIEIDLNNIKYSKLVFEKQDSITKKTLPNTKIELYKEDGTLIFTGITDKNGRLEIENLPLGKYYILEKEAPKDYKLNKNKLFFEITDYGQVIKLVMEDEKITNPYTGDKILGYVVLSFISLFSLSTIYVTKIKHLQK